MNVIISQNEDEECRKRNEICFVNYHCCCDELGEWNAVVSCLKSLLAEQ